MKAIPAPIAVRRGRYCCCLKGRGNQELNLKLSLPGVIEKPPSLNVSLQMSPTRVPHDRRKNSIRPAWFTSRVMPHRVLQKQVRSERNAKPT